MSSSFIKPFINAAKEPNLFQIPVTVKTRKGDVVNLTAIFQDTKPEGSSIGTVFNAHGAPGSHKDYKYINPKLEAAGVRIIGINWPGCGYTSYDERLENHNFERVQFAQQILDALNLPNKSVIFMGHSRGSENALKMAALNEEKTIGLISVNPIGIRPHRGAHIRLFHLLAAFWRIMALRWFSNWILYHIYTKFAKFKVLDGHTCGVAMCMLTRLDYSDAIPYIEKYNKSDLRALLLYAGKDWLIEPEISREFLSLFDNEYEISSFIRGEDPEATEAVKQEILNDRKTIGVFCAKDGHFLQKDRGDLIAEAILTMFRIAVDLEDGVLCLFQLRSVAEKEPNCHKDFDQKSYVAHYSCVTEAERVQGSLYKAKENKAEKKRKMWTDAIYKAIKNAKDGQVRKILNSIKDEPNTPMKEAPFKNFLKNKGIHNPLPATEAFRLIKEAADEVQQESSKKNDVEEEIKKETAKESSK